MTMLSITDPEVGSQIAKTTHVGDTVTFQVRGVVKSIDADIIDVTSYGTKREFLVGSRIVVDVSLESIVRI